MLGIRLSNFKDRKRILDFAVGDCIIFREPSNEYDRPYDSTRSPLYHLIGVIIKITPAESKRAVVFECKDAFTGAEFEHKCAYYMPHTNNPRSLRIITPDAIENERWLNSISGPDTRVRFVSHNSYHIDGHPDVKISMSENGWIITRGGDMMMLIDNPTNVGWVAAKDGRFISHYRMRETRWFEW